MIIRSGIIVLLICCPALLAQTTNFPAPGRPGADAHWPSAAKDGFGTANNVASKVWFTLNNGVMTEAFYPRLDVPNVQCLQLIIVGSGVETESEDTTHRVEVLDSRALTFRQVNTAKNGNYTIKKTYVTDPRRNTILIDVEYASHTVNNLFVYYDPSLNNSGMHDTAWAERDALLAKDGNIASALVVSSGFAPWTVFPSDERTSEPQKVTNGFFQTSDGLLQLQRNWQKSEFEGYQRAEDGNVVQVAALKGMHGPFHHFTIALSFGRTAEDALREARGSLATGFTNIRRNYESGWHRYARTLPTVEARYQRQFNVASLVLKALEDKTYRGAFIASPSIPWGGGPNANEPTISGYHAVWARDLYHIATALLALHDRAAAARALDYLLKTQQKADGSFPQNTWADGRAIGSGLQMDQVALPIVLAWQLGRYDRATWSKHIKPAADFILDHGPATDQDRWEEKPGYSPATIAAEIAGLTCAADIATKNGDLMSAGAYRAQADQWAGSVERWTVVENSRIGHGYFLRVTKDDDPNDGDAIEINSNGGTYDEREIVDAGFLELVRLGIISAESPLIRRSLEVADRFLKIETPNGSAWYRYNHDAYGERPDGGDYDGRNGKGRLWTLLNGERGEYELALGNTAAARKQLDAMMAFANDGMMIPEQVWDRQTSPRAYFQFGEGTGSATPLAWSMAQFVRLAMNVKVGHNIETPTLVLRHYRKAASN